MAQYLLSVMQPTGGTLEPDALEAIMRDLDALNEEIRAAGAWVFAGGLHGPESSTVVRAQGDGVLTTDGPFAEAKEHLGGITIIEVADLDEALRWAGRLAQATTLPIEVRPFAHGR